ncbi:MAG: hypothetical protein H6834_01275 [Planctomycetes bacterium]|nr:hypothetical protein [Planctomycetota bacterium]
MVDIAIATIPTIPIAPATKTGFLEPLRLAGGRRRALARGLGVGSAGVVTILF